MTHTLEVAQIARTIASVLNLNEDLTEAIALGHEFGHTPFGHIGEYVLQELTQGEFSHNKQSLRVVEYLENNGQGLNLTFEVRDGIFNHPTSGLPCTIEGKVVQLSDKIAYINHDIDDAIPGKVLLPDGYKKMLDMGDSKEQVVCDYIAGMTDRYAVNAYRDLFFPKSWHTY